MDWAVKLNGPISTEKFMGFMWPFSEGAVSKKKHKKEVCVVAQRRQRCVPRSSTDLASESLTQAKAQITNA